MTPRPMARSRACGRVRLSRSGRTRQRRSPTRVHHGHSARRLTQHVSKRLADTEIDGRITVARTSIVDAKIDAFALRGDEAQAGAARVEDIAVEEVADIRRGLA